MRELSVQDVRDIILGCTVLGTGGGGDPQIGLDLLEQDFEEGRTFSLVALDEVPDEEYVASPYVCGSISPETEEENKLYKGLTVKKEPTPAIAFQKLEAYMGTPFYGVISTELGGANTAYALHIGAVLGKKIIDGDFAGRSVPGVQHNTCNICNVPMTPFAVATKFGDATIFTDIVDELRAETLIRSLSVVSQNNAGVVDHPMQGKILQNSVIPNAISDAMKVGRIIRHCKKENVHAGKKLIEEFKGKELFLGTVESFSWETVKGYTEGEVVLNGTDAYKGEEYKIWFQNENIFSWRNGTIDVTVPDLICILDEDSQPVTNPNYVKGKKLYIFALPAPQLWKTERGIELFGPKSFGLDIDYEGI